ncbi:hypothetical protein LNV47_01575 [Paucibacter sp. DJ4R-1]|nr:hypothetical protein [Paucibacter sp. DJ4R-1]
MSMQWGLLGPATLLGERRTRSLGILRAVRRFNELAVPGIAGAWFGKQLALAVLGIRVAELARSRGLNVRNIQCANAIEALGCWLGHRDTGWVGHPRLRGLNKLPEHHALDFATFRKPGFYVSQPMRMAVAQALVPLGLAAGTSQRFNALETTAEGIALLEAAFETCRPFRGNLLEHLTRWTAGREDRMQTDAVRIALSPCEALGDRAHAILLDRLVLGGPQEQQEQKLRRRAVLDWTTQVIEKPATASLSWSERPKAITSDPHWNDLVAGAHLLATRDAALALLDEVERRLAMAPAERLQIEEAAGLVQGELTKLAEHARDFLTTNHTDSEARGFCQECVRDDAAAVLRGLLVRDGRVLKAVGAEVRPGSAFRRQPAPAEGSADDVVADVEGTATEAVGTWPPNISYRVPNLYLLNMDLRGLKDASLPDRAEVAA